MSHRIVPVEPTEEMRRAAGVRTSALTENDEVDRRRLVAQWKAATAAAPPYVVTDADVERAAEAAYNSLDSDPRFVGRPPFKNSPAREMYLHQQRAALEAFVKGLEGK